MHLKHVHLTGHAGQRELFSMLQLVSVNFFWAKGLSLIACLAIVRHCE